MGNAHRPLSRERLYAARVFVAGVVYMGADGVESHLLAREGAHKLLDVGPLIGLRIQPQVEIRGIEEDRHPIVYGAEQIVRFGGQERARFYL